MACVVEDAANFTGGGMFCNEWITLQQFFDNHIIYQASSLGLAIWLNDASFNLPSAMLENVIDRNSMSRMWYSYRLFLFLHDNLSKSDCEKTVRLICVIFYWSGSSLNSWKITKVLVEFKLFQEIKNPIRWRRTRIIELWDWQIPVTFDNTWFRFKSSKTMIIVDFRDQYINKTIKKKPIWQSVCSAMDLTVILGIQAMNSRLNRNLTSPIIN